MRPSPRRRSGTRRPIRRAPARYEEACRSFPGGNTRTVLFYDPFPLSMAGGEGARLRDLDGHEYRDFLGEYTAGVYGHSEPRILEEIRQALAGGVVLGAPNRYEVELAALVCARFPSIERVRFCNSGTEANLMALGLARAATGREKVLVFEGGYHGGVLLFKEGGERASERAVSVRVRTLQRPGRRARGRRAARRRSGGDPRRADDGLRRLHRGRSRVSRAPCGRPRITAGRSSSSMR